MRVEVNDNLFKYGKYGWLCEYRETNAGGLVKLPGKGA